MFLGFNLPQYDTPQFFQLVCVVLVPRYLQDGLDISGKREPLTQFFLWALIVAAKTWYSLLLSGAFPSLFFHLSK